MFFTSFTLQTTVQKPTGKLTTKTYYIKLGLFLTL
jgi:hypothetical protein